MEAAPPCRPPQCAGNGTARAPQTKAGMPGQECLHGGFVLLRVYRTGRVHKAPARLYIARRGMQNGALHCVQFLQPLQAFIADIRLFWPARRGPCRAHRTARRPPRPGRRRTRARRRSMYARTKPRGAQRALVYQRHTALHSIPAEQSALILHILRQRGAFCRRARRTYPAPFHPASAQAPHRLPARPRSAHETARCKTPAGRRRRPRPPEEGCSPRGRAAP